MSSGSVVIGQFNRGIIDKLGLARVSEQDAASGRVRMSAEIQKNWIPRVLGSMMLRPGLGYVLTAASSSLAIGIPFLYSLSDNAIIELSSNKMRVIIDGEAVTRPSVSTAITNGSFSTDVSGWTDSDETGATSQFASGGYMSLAGTGFKAARRRQQVTIASGDVDVQHALRVVIERGIVEVRAGTSAGGDEYFSATLSEGEHSLAFTPTGTTLELQLSAKTQYASLVDSILFESSGELSIETPWTESELRSIRWVRSEDVLFLSCNGVHPYKIGRRGLTSWFIEKDLPEDGPFRVVNTSSVTITPSATTGDITLTASDNLFKSTNVGGLYRIGSTGQEVSVSANGADQFSGSIRVSGVDETRAFTVTISGTWSGTVTLQRSLDEGVSWSDVTTYTGNTSASYDDELDNQIAFYRIGIKTGDYTSGTAECSLSYASGSLTGVVRVVGYTSATSVAAIVLAALGGTDASSDWEEGFWSERRGFPEAVALYEGRRVLPTKGYSILSESDAFSDFDSRTDGDSGPVVKNAGQSSGDITRWVYSGSRLVIGMEGGEIVSRQSFDEIVTPSTFATRKISNIGSADVPHAEIDDRAIFVDASATTLWQLTYNASDYGYAPSDLMSLVPSLAEEGIVRIAVQRRPDTRVHCVLSDGTVALLVDSPEENVQCWVTVETDGLVKDVFVVPAENGSEDSVYYYVQRTIQETPYLFLEKWAREDECQGETINKQADCFVTYSGPSTTTIPGFSHLEGEEVYAWGDGAYLGAFTVSGGEIELSSAVSNLCAGLYYEATYKSVKLAYFGNRGTALNQRKIIQNIAFILSNTHREGLRFGDSTDTLDDLPVVEEWQESTSEVYENYDADPMLFDGTRATDARLYLIGRAQRPCTVLSAVITMTTTDRLS